ncbi:TIGR03936 family radical SAM-associated protein [Natranaerobius trueperi]|uniref:DUF2344 domain-containing protein n=1 Tax=Natranaerobius trueperi TaxID=759412 RepID=A0A226C0M6_9FIRM|nr:TIGR03936 family radical SAM-associated protein [Natranaerobius trueperi]OWZ83927.1 hypothetical protein CDO51_05945 [Natranaerobius trueperi]
MKLWFRFEKIDKMIYISYIDLLQVLARGIKRAGVSISLSEGFNPQPKISFAHPLPLGVSSSTDFGELELNDSELESNLNLDELRQRINYNLPYGFNILDFKKPALFKPPKLMSLVEATSYEIECSNLVSKEELRRLLDDFRNKDKVTMQKKKKKSGKIVEKDIKPMIYDLEVNETSLIGTFQSGSNGNLRPDVFIRLFFQDENSIEKVHCSRTGLYFFDKNKELVTLWNWDELN